MYFPLCIQVFSIVREDIIFHGKQLRKKWKQLQNSCAQWLQPWNQKMLAPWKKSIDKPRQCIKKQWHLFADKGPSSQSFSSSPVWMCEMDHKEGLAQRIDVFKLWCWRRLLRVPWIARRSNQSILKEINPEYSLEELMLKREVQHFRHLMWRVDSLEKTLPDSGKDWK